MTDEAKKLVEALREDAEWAHANEWETPITLGDHLEAAAELIEELTAKQPTWISVKERLPSGFDCFEDGTVEPAEYIVKVKGASVATIAMFDGKEWIPAQYNGNTEDRWFVSPITHWMPLPEPPEEEA